MKEYYVPTLLIHSITYVSQTLGRSVCHTRVMYLQYNHYGLLGVHTNCESVTTNLFLGRHLQIKGRDSKTSFEDSAQGSDWGVLYTTFFNY